MEKLVKILKDYGVFYLATVDGDKPRVRPFGAVFAFEGKLYFTTGAKKDVFKQMQKNPNIEISATSADGSKWIRLQAKAVLENKNTAAKAEGLRTHPMLVNIYKNAENEDFAVFYADKIQATLYTMGGAPEKLV